MTAKQTTILLVAVLLGIPVLADAKGAPAPAVLDTVKKNTSSGTISNPLDPPRARRQVLVGPTFLVNRNYHSGGFHPIADASCPLFENGNGWGFGLGLTAEFLPVVNGSWSIIPRVTFEQRPATFYQELPNVPISQPISPDSNAILNQTVATTAEITYTLLNMELLYKKEILVQGGIRFGVLAGPALSYVLGGTSYQVQDLIEPENARFIPVGDYQLTRGGRRMIFYDGDIPSRTSTRFSLKGGVQCEIGLFGNQWIMTQGLYYDYGVTNVTAAESWGLNSLILQTDFRRAF